MKEIYLDNSATTRVLDDIAEHMSDIFKNRFGNPSSMHTKGIEAERLIKEARSTIASILGAASSEIYFTSGGTESNNLAVRGYLSANLHKGRKLVTSRIEHPSVLEIFRNLEQQGYEVTYLGVDESGKINLDELSAAITQDTALVSIMMVNNETGSIQPVEAVSNLIKRNSSKTVLHVDAVQAFGKYPIDVHKYGIDILTVSSHKIHGPKGVGAVYISKKIRVKPIMSGGGQESSLRSGTENVPGISGFGKAAEKVALDMNDNFKKVDKMNKLFRENLKSEYFNYHIISPEDASPYILNVSFPGTKAEVLLHHLEREGIYVSTGSACSSRKKLQSHVLTALSLTPSVIDGAIRFSFSAYENCEEDALETIEALKTIVPMIDTARRIKKR